MANDKDVSVGFSADLAGLVDGFSEAKGKVAEGAGQIKEQLNGVGDKVESLKNLFLGLGTSILAGFGMKAIIDELKTTTFELDKMSNMLGTTMEDAKILGQELTIVGTSLEAYAHLVRMVTMRINSNEQAYIDEGVAIRDSQKALLPTPQILQNIIDKTMEYEKGQDRNTIAMRLTGRGFQELIAMQRLSMVNIEELKEKQERLNAVVGEESVEAVVHYNTAMNGAKQVVEAMNKTIADSFMPVLSDMANWFSDTGPGKVDIFSKAMKQLASAVLAAFHAYVSLGEEIGYFFARMAKMPTLTDMLGAKSMGELKAMITGQTAVLTQMAEDHKAKMLAIVASTQAALDQIWNQKPDDKKAEGHKKASPTSKGGGEDPEAGYMKQFNEQLKQQTLLWEIRNDGVKMAKELEDDFWASAVQFVKHDEDAMKNSASVYNQIINKMMDARLQAELKHVQDTKKIGEIQAQGDVKAAQDSIAVKKEELSQKVKLGLIGKEEELKQLRIFEDDAFNIEMKAAEDKAELMKAEPVKYAEQLQTILALKRKHNLELKKLDDEMQVEQVKTWTTIFASVQSAFSGAVQGIIAGTTTLRKALANIATAIGSSLINELAIKPFIEYVKLQWMMVTVTQESEAAKLAAKTAGTSAGMAVEGAGVLASIGNYAAEAFAGVWSALSGIPIVGPALAAAGAPLAMAAVIGVGSMVKHSFDTGIGQVPYDMPAMIHKDEAVLSKPEAQAYRDGHGGGGGMTVNISAVDAAGVKRLFMDHGSTLADALRRQGRNFKPATLS